MGEWLVRELRQYDVTAKAQVTLADVEATLEELYVSLRVSFGGMTEARFSTRRSVPRDDRIKAILAAGTNW